MKTEPGTKETEATEEPQLSPEAKRLAAFKAALDGEDEADDKLLLELLDKDGVVKADMTLPDSWALDVMAQQLLQHISQYRKAELQRQAARASDNHKLAKELWENMNYHRLTAAIIQRAYPKAKAMADEIGHLQAKSAADTRKKQLEED